MNIWGSIGAANGEIRLQQIRYAGPGWYCLIVPFEVDEASEVWDAWDDLVGGDIEWMDALDFFRADDYLVLATGNTPELALSNARALSEAHSQ